VEAAYGGFSAKNRARTSRDHVARVVTELRLEEARPRRTSPALRVRRLRFSGEKRLDHQAPEPFVFDQAFVPGVNVICIPDNGVGKSSILKTIKYALTGDKGDYDADVGKWITDVWLVFTLDRQQFTVLLSTRDGGSRALLVPGEEFRPLERVAEETTLAIFDVSGNETIKGELQRFFFQRIGLGRLSWTQQDASAPRGVAERGTSWLTYFQALQIPDGGHRYLICDEQHAMGNQDGLIFSAFLGLNLVEPLNRLSVEIASARKEVKLQERLTADQIQQATKEVARVEAEIQVLRARLREIEAAQSARRRAVEGGEPAQRLVNVQTTLVERVSERTRLDAELEELRRTLQRRRGRERQLREAVALRLHFTGLEVSLCPNCDAAVDVGAVERERTAHACRLCGKPAEAADAHEVAALNAEADDIKREIDNLSRGREAITERLGALRREIEALVEEVTALAEAAQRGIGFALPTAEEEVERNDLHERVGRLLAELAVARRNAEPQPSSEENERELHLRVVQKVREVLQDEAARRNREILERLSALTQDTARTIGAESISNVTCSPLGRVQLRKHGELVPFTGIQNEGERLRIKLAFFLAMMRLGREPALGRHPGFLIIDQPASGEMVPEDVAALARIFRRVDDDLADQLQIICCTTRREFEAATAAEKVYGPQNPPYAF
jgi:prefoldin subunit 5